MRIIDITSLAGMFLVIGLLLGAAWTGPLKPIARLVSDQPLYAAPGPGQLAPELQGASVHQLAELDAGQGDAAVRFAGLSR